MSPTTITDASWYDQPACYDLAFRSETPGEADFIEAACCKYCAFPARRLLEPACGTGRLIAELAARGHAMIGFDRNRAALAYLRRRLARRKLPAVVFSADMADFRLPESPEIRPRERRLQHLRQLPPPLGRAVGAKSPGVRRPRSFGRAGSTSSASISCRRTPPRSASNVGPRGTPRPRQRDAPRAGLRPSPSLGAAAGQPAGPAGGKETVAAAGRIPLRLYTAAQFRRLLASVPQFELCDVYDFWYEIDHPLQLDNKISDTVFILAAPGGGTVTSEIAHRIPDVQPADENGIQEHHAAGGIRGEEERREGRARLVSAMHITASVFINDDETRIAPRLRRMARTAGPVQPRPERYHHNRTGEDNADAHLKRQVMGREVVVAITQGKLDFGPWEQIFYGEFDGRRPKRVLVKIIGE